MKINIKRIIKDIRGNEAKMSFPQSPEDTKKPETVENILLNALAAYPVEERKQVFYVNHIASAILGAGEDGTVEIKDEYADFLKDAVYAATFRKEEQGGKITEKGVYLPLVTAQVLEELGVTE
jgi:hypothetical protein